MKYETIIYEKEKNGIAVLTLNRPEVLNAINWKMGEEFPQALAEANDDDDVRVLILTGAGRGFCAGDDVKGMFLSQDTYGGDYEEHRRQARMQWLKGPPRQIPPFSKPMIGAINGAAVGAGMDRATACDIRIGTSNAKFGYFYVRRGIMPGSLAATVLLLEIVGLPRALEMMFSGELVESEEALKIGLISKIVPQEKLLDEARALAHKIVQGAPLPQIAIKRFVYRYLMDKPFLQDMTSAITDLLRRTEDHMEGSKAFTEKRDANWKMR
jgi:enoyl-CoA hydratase/carnithine racemase